MRTSRLFLDTNLFEQQTIVLEGERFNYIANVLRLKVGAEISIFNGQGGEYFASISSIQKRNATLNIGQFLDKESESPISITLAQGISRGERMDFTLQKATELGVNHIIPIFSERCSVSLKGPRLEKRIQHWQGVIQSACEQSGRNIIPSLGIAQTIDTFINDSDSPNQLLLDPTSTKGLHSIASTPSDITILIGPEGGFSDQERERAYAKGFQGIQLGSRILRTETAAIAAISAIQTLWGDFQ